MPYTCSIDPSRRLAVVSAYGAIDGDNVGGSVSLLVEDPAWQAGFDVLWDGRGITELSVSLEQVYAIVAESRRVQDRLGPGRTALVFRREIDYSIGYLYTQLTRSPSRERRVFRSLEQAAAWLGLADADAARACCALSAA